MRKPIADTYREQVALIDPNKPLRVYRNLHTGLWSVKQGVVRFHTKQIYLLDVQFVVNENNRQKVIREKRKNVHAYVVGYLSNVQSCIIRDYGIEVYYNPYKYDSFVCNLGKIESAYVCLMNKAISGKMEVLAAYPLMFEKVENTIVSTVETHLL